MSAPPPCIGRGADPDSRQKIPLAQCAVCSYVKVCCLLRFTSAVEDIARRHNQEDRSRRSSYDSAPARRWR
jgi:hypothetical protein